MGARKSVLGVKAEEQPRLRTALCTPPDALDSLRSTLYVFRNNDRLHGHFLGHRLSRAHGDVIRKGPKQVVVVIVGREQALLWLTKEPNQVAFVFLIHPVHQN